MRESSSTRPFVERQTVIASGDETLEGLYQRGTGGGPVLIAAPHPLLGGSMDAAVCAELAWALGQAGRATLRFNYRGVGASTGRSAGDGRELEDVRAALLSLRQTEARDDVALVGYSYGAWLVLRAAAEDARVHACVVVAPPTRRFDFDFDAATAHGAHLDAVLAAQDEWCDIALTSRAVQTVGGRVQTVANADHFFSRGLSSCGRCVVEALAGA